MSQNRGAVVDASEKDETPLEFATVAASSVSFWRCKTMEPSERPTPLRHGESAESFPLRTHFRGLANRLAQRSNGLSGSEAHCKLVLVSAADDRGFAGILSDPDHAFGVHKNLHAVHIFKHYELHVASFWQIPGRSFCGIAKVPLCGRFVPNIAVLTAQ